MNLNQLKYIVTVADEMNISRAAKKLFVSQPSLSQSIKNIEEELGTKIFERSPFKVTYAGEVYVSWARDILSSSLQIKQKIADISEQKNIKFVIGISPHRSTYILPPVIKKFKLLYPKSEIFVEEYPTSILQRMMDRGKLDLLIDVTNPDTISFESIPLFDENILLDIPLSWNINQKEVDIAILKDKPFIMLSEKQSIGKLGRELCMKSGFSPEIFLECHNIETAHALVRQNLGATFVPEMFTKFDKENSNYCLIKDFKSDRKICAIYNKKKYLPVALRDFIKVLKIVINEEF